MSEQSLSLQILPEQSPAQLRENASVPVTTYEDLLNRDPRWALSEGSRHFDEQSSVFKALREIARRLDAIGIPYAVVGGMALFHHGLRRFTEDVNILVTKGDLKRIHHQLDGQGYLPPHSQSKHLRDTELGVKIEFLTTGEFPGDGKSKPVAFPDPSTVSVVAGGVRYVNLPTLIELKLASGMTAPGRRKDLADVQELIKVLNLSKEFAEKLNPYVVNMYLQLCHESGKRYITTWRNKWVTAEAKTLPKMISMLRESADHLQQMFQDGVILNDSDSTCDDYALLVTTDAKIAEKYGMIEESEYWDEDSDAPDDTPDSESSA